MRQDLHEQITARIIAQIEAGTVPWIRPWSEIGGDGLPRNHVTNRAYSGINVIQLWWAAAGRGYKSGRWLTFKQAKAQGGSVKRGETGTEVIFLKPAVSKRVENGVEVEHRYTVLKSYTVFSHEQCEGIKPVPVKPPTVVTAGTRNASFVAAVEATDAHINTGGDRAFYTPTLDYIGMPTLDQFSSAAHYDATLAHELVHWTGHKTRLDRFGNTRTTASYAFEELIAELGASFICSAWGIDGDLRHADYLASWLKILKEDSKALMSAASLASKATAYLFPEPAESELDIAA
jgi:antirestriction protein ArdC